MKWITKSLVPKYKRTLTTFGEITEGRDKVREDVETITAFQALGEASAKCCIDKISGETWLGSQAKSDIWLMKLQ